MSTNLESKKNEYVESIAAIFKRRAAGCAAPILILMASVRFLDTDSSTFFVWCIVCYLSFAFGFMYSSIIFIIIINYKNKILYRAAFPGSHRDENKTKFFFDRILSDTVFESLANRFWLTIGFNLEKISHYKIFPDLMEELAFARKISTFLMLIGYTVLFFILLAYLYGKVVEY